MIEDEFTQSFSDVSQQETLLERLKRIKSTNEATLTQVDVTPNRDDTQFTNEFSRTVNILKQKAKTAVWSNSSIDQSERLRLIDLLNLIVIVPDEKLANRDNNELNLTVFVRSYLPKSEWPNYIPPINL